MKSVFQGNFQNNHGLRAASESGSTGMARGEARTPVGRQAGTARPNPHVQ